MPETTPSVESLNELHTAIAALVTPQAGAEILAHLEEVTSPAAHEHDLVLARSQELAGMHLFP